MALKLSDLTDAAAVQAALDEYSRLGQEAFLRLHGFGAASGFLVRNPLTDEWADSKAIAGVALAYQHAGSGGLRAAQFSGGEATVAPRLTQLGFEVRRDAEIQGPHWDTREVALIVADYLSMLTCELTGQAYNKSAHRRQLMQSLPGRTAGSVEFKHANISAAMLQLGFPYLKGYQPRANFQRAALLHEVAEQLARHDVLDEAALSAVQRPEVLSEADDFSRVKTAAPQRESAAREASPAYLRPAIQRDYLARESQNRSLGLAGEEFALRFERWRLIELGAGQLAEQVAHVSVSEGDGLGYDIRSFEIDGQQRFIEVKTTSFGERTPFFVSANELRFARNHATQFRLYRLFDFRATPRLFELDGPIDRHCLLDATTYRASFAA
jgi:hypothetical protein